MLNDIAQVVDSVQVNIRKVGDFAFNISGDCNIHHEHWLALALLYRSFYRALAENKATGGGAITTS